MFQEDLSTALKDYLREWFQRTYPVKKGAVSFDKASNLPHSGHWQEQPERQQSPA